MPKSISSHLSVIISALAILAGFAFGYGQLTERVDGVLTRQDKIEEKLTKIDEKLDLRLGLKAGTITP